MTRLRMRKPADVEPNSWPDYMRGKELWRDGLTPTTPSPALKFGYEGHNYLGFADAWNYDGASDATLAAAFDSPATMDAEARRLVLNLPSAERPAQPAPEASPSEGPGGATYRPRHPETGRPEDPVGARVNDPGGL